MHTSTPVIFDRQALRQHQNRATRSLDDFSFLFEEIGNRLIERLDDVTRAFPTVVDLGSHGGMLSQPLSRRAGTQQVFSTDAAAGMLERGCHQQARILGCDEEALPFADSSLDLVVSSLSLHWVNDLPGTLVQIRRALKPDGLFLAALFGGHTLHELRQCLLEAESEVEGGASPRISPFVDIRDMGMLMQRAGFALPVIDCDTIPVTYDSALKLMKDLQGMGESNILTERRQTFSRRETLLRAAERYERMFANDTGRLTATFQIIWVSGWAPAATQPKALRPGTATHSLAEALGATVCGLDDTTGKG